MQPHPDVRDQRRTPGRPLLHDVEHLPAVQHGQVRGLADAVDEPGQHRPRQPGERFLREVGGAELERRDAQTVAPLLRQVDGETGADQLAEQVVDGRSG